MVTVRGGWGMFLRSSKLTAPYSLSVIQADCSLQPLFEHQANAATYINEARLHGVRTGRKPTHACRVLDCMHVSGRSPSPDLCFDVCHTQVSNLKAHPHFPHYACRWVYDNAARLLGLPPLANKTFDALAAVQRLLPHVYLIIGYVPDPELPRLYKVRWRR